MAVLPEYTFSSIPSYSPIPRHGEERIEYTPRPEATVPEGNFIKAWKHATLILPNQGETNRLPTYGQNSVVSGELHLSTPKDVLRIVLKLEGRMYLSIAEGPSGSTTSNTVSSKTILWSQEGSNSFLNTCPTVLPFCLQFPSTFSNDGRLYKLPPSFEASFLGISALIAQCTYCLRLSITMRRRTRLGSWKTSKSYTLFLDYRPRARARHRLSSRDSVFAGVKTEPADWLQLISTMGVRSNSKVESIDCHFVLPSASTFALTDAVPFHIQLHGSLTSLRELLPPACPLLVPQPLFGSRPIGSSTRTLPIQVLITRQVVVEVNERRSLKNTILGVGRIWPLPPPITRPEDDPLAEISVGWEGQVQCGSGAIAPGFSTGNLLVKDYIMLILTPPNSRTSPLRELQIVHPIRLVTDPWVDTDTLHPQDT
ncbi:hypothetical protein Hypma_007770 [Hypsizygus marmoreus]|uniref:Arrestin-like N-terminal domain-containing protein n=1 Tax=Hypsizygus marmoreus TaxID=39966 RepID=A0A369JU07_HYPMA|nr:hypothetical protein Hypma_007770 [Hypsizygus marmoreus]